MNPLLVNRCHRAMRCPGFLGARVQGKALGSSRREGVGDCILLDFSKGFFAVADGSDRNPSASREFMVMFSRMIETQALLSTGRVYNTEEVSALKQRLIVESEALLVSLPFRNGSTFTGLLILQTIDGMTGIVMHTGDSLLIHCDLDELFAFQHTSDNFWMVGRSRHFFQIDDLSISRASRILLATDGISGVPVPPGMNREEFILNLFKTCSADEIPDRILGGSNAHLAGWDDMAIVAIDPYAMTAVPGCLIIGGTSRLEEGILQEDISQGLFVDRYVPISLSDGNSCMDNIL
jgi:hypothetical protein